MARTPHPQVSTKTASARAGRWTPPWRLGDADPDHRWDAVDVAYQHTIAWLSGFLSGLVFVAAVVVAVALFLR